MPARASIRDALAVVATIGLGAGCGSDDGAGKPSIVEAKATLSRDCQQGQASKKSLCDCIADNRGQPDNEAEEIRAIDKPVSGGQTPPPLEQVVPKCISRAAP